MKLKSKITVEDKSGKLFECVKCEQKTMSRSTLKIKRQKDNIVFDMSADDATALRATLNSVLKLLIVYEKSSNIK